MNFKVYLERYVTYLNEYCVDQLEGVLKKVQEIEQGRQDKKNVNEGFSFFNLDFNSLI